MRLPSVFFLLLGACSAAVKPSGRPLIARADSLALIGDTTAALAVLDSAVARNRMDAATWHRNGMLTWALVRPTTNSGIPTTPRSISLMQRVDSSLRLAVAYAPDSGRYHLDLGRFFLHANVITMRMQAPAQFEKAVAAGRRVGDSSVVSEALDEIGMVYWRRYEAVANRRALSGLSTVAVDQLLQHPDNVETFIANNTITPAEWAGQLDYLQSTESFAAAQKANPSSSRVARHRFMALAERNRWEELESATAARLEMDSSDAIAWLAQGLAYQRLRDAQSAQSSFQRGVSLLPPAERVRYSNISRLMKRADSVEYAAATEASRNETNRIYWALADPLVLTTANENLLEFLSRIAYADLRWSSDDLDRKGADSDRGQVYIRYGPPPVIISFAPNTSNNRSCPDCPTGNDPGAGTIIWWYPDTRLSFIFRAPPSYGTAAYQFDFKEVAERIRERVPASFRNVDIVREMDTVAVQLARFRTSSDSTDVLVLAEIPLRRMTANTDLASGPVDVALATYDQKARRLAWDSTRKVVRFDRDLVEKRAWRERHGPGTIAYRIEALQPDAMRGARAIGTLDVVHNKGYGLSDVVVGQRIVPRDSASSQRWTDMLIVPSAGVLRRGESFGVLWETYDLAARGGSSRYTVELSLTVLEVDRSDEKTGKTDFATRIIGGVADAIGVSARGDDRVTLKYTREHDARPVALNYLTIDLGDAPRGRYRLRIDVTDLVSSKRATTERFLTVTK